MAQNFYSVKFCRLLHCSIAETGLNLDRSRIFDGAADECWHNWINRLELGYYELAFSNVRNFSTLVVDRGRFPYIAYFTAGSPFNPG
jgi:hypothetical protein